MDREDYWKQVLAGEDDIGEGCLMQIVEVEPDNHIKPHYHEKTKEIFYILQPGGKLVIDDEEIEPDKGDVIICEPGDVHEVMNESEKMFVILVFKKDNTEDDTIWLDE